MTLKFIPFHTIIVYIDSLRRFVSNNYFCEKIKKIINVMYPKFVTSKNINYSTTNRLSISLSFYFCKRLFCRNSTSASCTFASEKSPASLHWSIRQQIYMSHLLKLRLKSMTSPCPQYLKYCFAGSITQLHPRHSELTFFLSSNFLGSQRPLSTMQWEKGIYLSTTLLCFPVSSIRLAMLQIFLLSSAGNTINQQTTSSNRVSKRSISPVLFGCNSWQGI